MPLDNSRYESPVALVLERARDRIKKPNGWIRNRLATRFPLASDDHDEYECDVRDAGAVAFCALGAISRESEAGEFIGRSTRVYYDAVIELSKTIHPTPDEDDGSDHEFIVHEYNDSHSKGKVVRAFDETIDRVRGLVAAE